MFTNQIISLGVWTSDLGTICLIGKDSDVTSVNLQSMLGSCMVTDLCTIPMGELLISFSDTSMLQILPKIYSKIKEKVI